MYTLLPKLAPLPSFIVSQHPEGVFGVYECKLAIIKLKVHYNALFPRPQSMLANTHTHTHTHQTESVKIFYEEGSSCKWPGCTTKITSKEQMAM